MNYLLHNKLKEKFVKKCTIKGNHCHKPKHVEEEKHTDDNDKYNEQINDVVDEMTEDSEDEISPDKVFNEKIIQKAGLG